MHYKAFLSFALLGSSTVQSLPSEPHYSRGLYARDVLTLPAIKTAFKHGTDGINAVNEALKAVTAANSKEQLAVVNTALNKLAAAVSDDTKKIKSSGAIGIGEILGLASEAPRNELLSTITGLFTALNNTFTTFAEKRDIIKDSGAVDTIVPGIKAQRQGLVDIVSIVPSQVPSIAKGPINNIISGLAAKAAAPPAAPAAPPAMLRRQSKGSTPKGGAPKGGSPKGSSPSPGGGAGKSPGGGKSPSAGASSGGVTLDSLLASPESIENIGKAIDAGLDRAIDWLRGKTDSLVPPELAEQLAKGVPKGPKPGAAPKDAAPKPAT